MHTKYCPNCRHKVPLNAKFCNNCGYRFKTTSDSLNSTKTNNKMNDNNIRDHSHKLKWVITIIIILIIGVVGYTTYHHITNPPIKPLTKAMATNKTNNIWECAQNRINNNGETNNNIPMSSYFISGANNKGYKDINTVFKPSQNSNKVHASANSKILSISPSHHNKHTYNVNDKVVMTYYSNNGNGYPMTMKWGFTFKSSHGKWLVSNINSLDS